MENIAAPILALLIMLWGFSIILRPLFGGGGSYRPSGSYGGGSGFVGRLFLGLFFSVLLPIAWWTIALVGRLYHRTFIVFTEFLSGVHDWSTYRTSSLKYGGAFFAFLGFNGVLLLVLSLLASGAPGAGVSPFGWIALLSVTVACSLLARTLMRRMP